MLVLTFAIPVLAQGHGHTCTHNGATIDDLQACFQHALHMGHIDNQGVARSLFAKLDAAAAALGDGQTDTAVNMLYALVNSIEAQSGKHIDEQHASHMVGHTQRVIDAIS